jgi:uncharacterized protein YlxW (UPF0749 family)
MLNNEKETSQIEIEVELKLKSQIVRELDERINELEQNIKVVKNTVAQYYSFQETEAALINVLNTLNTCRNSLRNDFERFKNSQ